MLRMGVDSGTNAKRERALTVASELFSRQDFGAVLMDEVAGRARVAKGTLYNYFGSKDALYREVMTTRLEHLISVLRESTRQRDDVRMNVRRVAVHVMSFMLKYPDFFRIWKREEGWACNNAHHPLSRLRANLHGVLIEVLERGASLGVIRPMGAAWAANLIFGTIDGAVYRSIGRRVPRDEILAERDGLADFVWCAIRAVPDDT